MKRIVFTKHAEEMLSVRKINKALVASCLTQPTRVTDVRESKYAYLKDFGANNLKVIVSDEKDAFVVITLYWVAKHQVKQ